MKKILIAAHEFDPFAGGIASYVKYLSEAGAAETDLTLLVPDYNSQINKNSNIRYLRFRGGNFNAKNLLHFFILSLRFYFLTFFGNFRCILIADWPFVLVAAFCRKYFGLRKSVIFMTHGTDILILQTSRLARLLGLKNTLFTGAEKICANSRFTASLFEKYYSVRPVQITPLGVDYYWFQNSPGMRKTLCPDRKKILIGTVARLDARKGIDYAFDALTLLPENLRRKIIYAIAGSGDKQYEKELRERAANCGVKCLFIGRLDRENLLKFYYAIDIFLLPGKSLPSRVEGFGLVFLEAAAAGLPLLAGKVDAIDEIVLNRQNGFLIREGDSKQMAKALQTLAENFPLRQKLGQNARRIAQNYTWIKTFRLTFNTEKKIKTVLIVNDLLELGGAELQTRREKNILETHGINAHVLTFDTRQYEQYKEKDGFYNLVPYNSFFGKLFNKLFAGPRLTKKIKKIINFLQPDIIHCNNIYRAPRAVLAAIKNFPSVKTFRDYSHLCPIGDLVIPSEKKTCRGYRQGKCFSGKCGNRIYIAFKLFEIRLLRKKLKEFYALSPSANLAACSEPYGYKMHPVPNPFLAEWKVPQKREKDRRRYVYMGLIQERKGIFDLLPLWSKFAEKHNTYLEIAGRAESAEKKRLDDLLKKYPGAHYRGVLPYSEIGSFLAGAYALIVPSVWMENYPNTVLEAFACGTLVLGSRRGGIPELLAENRGIIFDVENTESLYRALEQAHRLSSAAYKTITGNGRKYIAAEASPESFYLKLLKIFQEEI
ncbi:MAG: hypothetical protein A2096_05570 [Spirochaetes bacterium GWF1_41_5]|nr:MAG: hypothetical protein A2096_05570 [Spirochaetes bacterium GWF1_41_5]